MSRNFVQDDSESPVEYEQRMKARGYRIESIKLFAMRKANISSDELDTSLGHVVDCDCSCCRKFRVYLPIKELITEWERLGR